MPVPLFPTHAKTLVAMPPLPKSLSRNKLSTSFSQRHSIGTPHEENRVAPKVQATMPVAKPTLLGPV